jgi:hypothetical protein
MTRWERFYRAMGGVGPESPKPYEDIGWREPFFSVSHLARILLRRGFLMRDPEVPYLCQAFFTYHRWQWRFWRGPYWAVLERNAARAALWHQWSSLRRGIVARIDPDFTSWVQDEHGWFWGNRRPGDTPPSGLLNDFKETAIDPAPLLGSVRRESPIAKLFREAEPNEARMTFIADSSRPGERP